MLPLFDIITPLKIFEFSLFAISAIGIWYVSAATARGRRWGFVLGLVAYAGGTMFFVYTGFYFFATMNAWRFVNAVRGIANNPSTER